MSYRRTSLFRGQSIDHFLQGETAFLQRRVEALSSLEELEARAEGIADSAVVEHCRLARADAKSSVAEEPDGVKVQVTVPVEGNVKLLSVSFGEAYGPGVYAGLEGGSSPSTTARLSLDQSFPPSTAATAVRAWAKDQIDTIEEGLGKIHAKVDEHNANAKTVAYDLLGERRRILQTAARLRDDLQGGI